MLGTVGLYLLIVVSAPVLIAPELPQAGDTRLAGRITDWQGCPLEGVSVTVVGGSGQSVTGLTGKNGEYEVVNVPTGRVVLTAQLTGFQDAELRTTIVRGRNLWDTGLALGRLTYTEPHRISGVVRDVQGQPLSAASITLSNAFSAARITQVRTDREGRFNVEVYDPGHYFLSAVAKNHRPESQVVTFDRSSGSSTTVQFELRRHDYCKDQ